MRREVWMRGWTARVNGRPTSVSLSEDTFQAIQLPAGTSKVVFDYDPAWVRFSFWPALGALFIAFAFILTARPRRY